MASLWQNLQQANSNAAEISSAPEASNEQNYVQHMRQSWSLLRAKVCVITSGEDLTAQEFLDLCQQDPQWQQLLKHAEHHHLPQANHTFSTTEWRGKVEQISVQFITNKKA